MANDTTRMEAEAEKRRTYNPKGIAPVPSDVKGDHIADAGKLVPLTDPSVLAVAVKEEQYRPITSGEFYLGSGNNIFQWYGTAPTAGHFKPVTIRPASEFGVAARGEPGLKKLPEDRIKNIAELIEFVASYGGIVDSHAGYGTLLTLRRFVKELSLYGIPDGGERTAHDRSFLRVSVERDKANERIKELEAELRDWPDCVACGRGIERCGICGECKGDELQLGHFVKEVERLTKELNQATHDGQRMAVAVHALDEISDAVPGSDDTTDYMEVARRVVAKIKSDEKEMIADTDQICSLLDRASAYKSEIERLRKAIEEHRDAMLSKGLDGTHDCDDRLWSALSPSPAAASGEKLRTTSFSIEPQADGRLKRTVRSETLTEFAERVEPTSAPAAESEGGEAKRIAEDLQWLRDRSARLAACEGRCKELEDGIKEHKWTTSASPRPCSCADHALWSLLAPKAGGEQ